MTARSTVVGLLALIAVLAGCAGTPTGTQAGTTRTVSHALGTAEVPVSPQRVVAIDEYAALTALTLGVRPSATFGSYGSEIAATILDGAGAPVTPRPEFFAGAVPVEEISRLDPDLIVITGGPEVQSVYDALTPVAPVVAAPYYNTTWQENLRVSAAAFGREDRGEQIRTTVESRLARLGRSAPADPVVLSVIGESGGQCCFSAARGTPLSAVLRDAGFARPPAQDVNASIASGQAVVPISPERMGEHDGDLVVVPQGAFYDAARVRAVPTFRSLPAVRDGRVLQVDGDMWFGSLAFAIDWIATDVEAIRAGRGQEGLGVPGAARARWDAFLATLPGEGAGR